MRTCCARVAVYLNLLVAVGQADALAQGAPAVAWEGRSQSGYVYTVAFSPDGQMVATGTGGHLNTILTLGSLSIPERER